MEIIDFYRGNEATAPTGSDEDKRSPEIQNVRRPMEGAEGVIN